MPFEHQPLTAQLDVITTELLLLLATLEPMLSPEKADHFASMVTATIVESGTTHHDELARRAIRIGKAALNTGLVYAGELGLTMDQVLDLRPSAIRTIKAMHDHMSEAIAKEQTSNIIKSMVNQPHD